MRQPLSFLRLSFGQTSDDMEYFDTLQVDGGVVIGFLFVTLVALAGNWRLFVKSANLDGRSWCLATTWSSPCASWDAPTAMRCGS